MVRCCSKLINPSTTVRVSKSFTDKCLVSFLRNLVVNVSFETFLSATTDKTNGTFYSFSKDEVFVKICAIFMKILFLHLSFLLNPGKNGPLGAPM